MTTPTASGDAAEKSDPNFGSVPLVVLLSLIMATAAFGTDMYLPAFPAIRTAFDTTPEAVQLSLSVFLYGNAFGQLVIGPFSDRYGRRPVLLAGLAAYSVATFGCALADDISAFIGYRLVQGAAAATGPVVVRALINDRLKRQSAARMLALLTGLMAVTAMLTPIAGGWIVQYLSWHWIFYTIGGIGAMLFVAASLNTRETLPSAQRLLTLGPKDILRGYLEVGCDVRFWGFAATPSLMFAGVFAYVSVNSFLLIDVLGMAEHHYGMTYATAAFAFVVGSFTSHGLVRRVGIERTIDIGLAIGVVSALAALSASLALPVSIALVVLPGLTMFFATALLLPVALSAAVSLFPARAGTASAVAGFINLMFAAGGAAAAAHLVDSTTTPLHVLTLVCCSLAALAWIASSRLRSQT